MKATQFEFRFRVWIIFAIFFLGFWVPWLHYGRFATSATTTTWLELSGELSRLLPLQTASVVVTCAAIFFYAVGTAFRVWGTAYIGGSVMHSSSMHARSVVAAGPYRHVRNPLYLGNLLFGLGVAILMPPSGAIFFLAASFVLYCRLILREESYLETQQGEVYLAYKRRVPRWLPSPAARLPESDARPQWLQAFIAETFCVAMTGCFVVMAWRYNAGLLVQALLICFGLSLVVRAFAEKKV